MPKVLLVDDEPNIRWTTAELLKREGFETLAAEDFDSALALARINDFDAALVDIILPRLSGIELLKEFAKRDSYTPVVMMTGEPSLTDLPEIVRAGAYDFLAKPLVKEVLIQTVTNAVENKRLVDEKRRLEMEVKRHTEQLETMVAERTRELADAHSFLNTVLDSSMEYAIIATDLAGRVILFNRGAELLFGFQPGEILGKSAAELSGDGDGNGGDESVLLALCRKACATGRLQSEAPLGRSGGNRFIASIAANPLREADGRALGYLFIVNDVTARKLAESEMREMQARLAHNEKIAALGRVAAQVAHEVKNPLTGLRLFALHLKAKVTGKLAAQETTLLDKIIDGVDHLSSTVERVLDFARPISLARRWSDLNLIVAGAAQVLEPQIAASGIQAEIRLSEPRGGMAGLFDEVSLRSAFINLMLNAVEAMPGGGRITVVTEKRESAFHVTISDTGRGMSAEDLKHVFEPFRSTKGSGLGLGMSYAKKIIDEHGGRIVVTGGHGVTVEIALPGEDQEVGAAK